MTDMSSSVLGYLLRTGSFEYQSIRSVSTTRRDVKVSNMAWDI